MGWVICELEIVYENVWICVCEDCVIGLNGYEGIYGVVMMWYLVVFVVVVDDDECVCFVMIDCYIVGMMMEIFVGGSDGEDLLVVVQCELFEEIGYVVDVWILLGRMNVFNGIVEVLEYVFLVCGF